MKKVVEIIVCLFLCCTSNITLAHHSFAADFDYDRTGTIEGVVTEVFFRQPHVQYYLTVATKEGKKNTWATATMSPNSLVRWGWSKNTVKRGDKVKMSGNLGRRNTNALWIRSLELEDGRVIKPSPGGFYKSLELEDGTETKPSKGGVEK